MAAGLGFKTFTTGEVLTAADTNGYLMQGVLVFASSAARAAAITSPQEGQYSYLKDTNSTEYYDGAAWIAAPIGDITGVTAGTGISGGGTSGTVTITNSMATEIAAKGDLIIGTGAAAFDNLTVGANGTVLTADSTVSPTGLKWATPASGGKVLQVVYARFTTETSQTTATETSIGLSATITPSSSLSKVLILNKTRFEFAPGTATTGVNINLYRGASSIVQLDQQASRPSGLNISSTSHYLDSPATTSATTYTIYGRLLNTTGTVYWQANTSQSDIVLMEIGA